MRVTCDGRTVRFLVSEDSFARRDPDTLAALKQKHPGSSHPLSFPLDPSRSSAVSVTVEDVVSAFSSFYTGEFGRGILKS